MFNVNDYIVYSSMGVCRVADIRKEEDMNGNEAEYYILQPVYGNNMTIKTPVNNQKVVMRSIVSKEEILSLIASMPQQETVWIEDNRQRSENFKAALKTGECAELIKLIKTIYTEKQEKSSQGKKLSKADEDIFRAAEKHLYEEFAVVLNIPPEEALHYIFDHIK